jgi:hypothetical protein
LARMASSFCWFVKEAVLVTPIIIYLYCNITINIFKFFDLTLI